MLQSLFNVTQFSNAVLEDNDSCECVNCSDTIEVDDAIEVDNDRYCSDCVTYCENCENPTVDDLTSVYVREYGKSSQDYCDDCLDDTFRCDDCEDHFSDDLEQYDIQDTNRNVCGRCYYNGSYFYCEDCGYCYSVNQYNSNGDGSYCDHCYSENHASSDRIFDYSEDPLGHLDFLGDPKDNLFLGLELEVYATDLAYTAETVADLLDGYAILKEDSSISKPGFEIVSAPCDIPTHRDKLKEFFAQDPAINSGSGKDIGLHIHVSREPLSQLTIGKLLVFVNDTDNYANIIKLAGRSSDNWAKLTPKIITDVNRQTSRYEAINLQNDNTVEFRIFGSTCNVELILARLEFVHAVVSWAKNESMLNLSWLSFRNYARDNSKLYPSLCQWLEEN